MMKKVVALLSLLVSAQVVQADTRVYELFRNTVNDRSTATLFATIPDTQQVLTIQLQFPVMITITGCGFAQLKQARAKGFGLAVYGTSV